MPHTKGQIDSIITKATDLHKQRGGTDLSPDAISAIHTWAAANADLIDGKVRAGWSDHDLAKTLSGFMHKAATAQTSSGNTATIETAQLQPVLDEAGGENGCR